MLPEEMGATFSKYIVCSMVVSTGSVPDLKQIVVAENEK